MPHMDADGVRLLADALTHLPALQRLNLNGNCLSSESACALAPSIGLLSLLRHLDVSGNELDAMDVEALSPALLQRQAPTQEGN